MRKNKTISPEIQKISDLLQLMASCDEKTLTAAIAMLPDCMNNGTMVVLAASTRVIAERFKDTKKALEMMETMVAEHLKAMSEK